MISYVLVSHANHLVKLVSDRDLMMRKKGEISLIIFVQFWKSTVLNMSCLKMLQI